MGGVRKRKARRRQRTKSRYKNAGRCTNRQNPGLHAGKRLKTRPLKEKGQATCPSRIRRTPEPEPQKAAAQERGKGLRREETVKKTDGKKRAPQRGARRSSTRSGTDFKTPKKTQKQKAPRPVGSGQPGAKKRKGIVRCPLSTSFSLTSWGRDDRVKTPNLG